jgi:drug/metabolite transporter (DMT)-like permease
MPLRMPALTALALVAFAANSLLCRAALAHTRIDAATFTTVRLLSGAIVLGLIAWRRAPAVQTAMAAGSATPTSPPSGIWSARARFGGDWAAAAALFAYALGFSFAYVQLPAAAGALLLFGAVQATMIGWGLWKGERLRALQLAGVVVACGGLAGLLLPGLSAPPLAGAALMVVAGVGWGVYSLRGRRAADPLRGTAGNFLRSAPMALLASAWFAHAAAFDAAGVGYAIASGALASGLGYAIWYTALPSLKATTAATVQLCVPVIAAGGGIAFLGEPLTLRFVAASVAILGGIALVTAAQRQRGHVPRERIA